MPTDATDDTALCPKCGCPPRYVIVTARVRCIYADGEIGKITGVCDLDEQLSDASIYECGGGHRWTKQPTDAQELPQYTKEQLVEFMEDRDPRHDLRSFICELLTFISREDLQALCESVPALLPVEGDDQ